MADEVLFPNAISIDAGLRAPDANLDALANAGLYGLVGSRRHGGLGLGADIAAVGQVVETLASGCLTTTLVWAQHHSLVRALMTRGAPSELRAEWLGPLCRGERRAGVALGGLLPGPPRVRAEPSPGVWRLHGTSPWVSGWGMVDVLHVAARGPDDTVVWLLVDAVAGPTLSVSRSPLVAVDTSATVELAFEGLEVPATRIIATEPLSDASYSGAHRLRFNGFFALGLASRCQRLMDDEGHFTTQIDACRRRLLAATDDSIAAARAEASHLAVRASSALVVRTGSSALRTDHCAQQLAREALFLLVFATRPPIRAALLGRLAFEGQDSFAAM